MEACPDYGTGQVAARALERAGMLEQVFKPIAAYQGYSWYDELDRITGISVTATSGCKTETLMGDEPDGPEEYLGESARVDRITVTLHVASRRSGAQRDIFADARVIETLESWEDRRRAGD